MARLGGTIVLSEEGNRICAPFRCELHIHVITNYVDIRIEYNVEVETDPVANCGRIRFGSACGNIVKALRLTFRPGDLGSR